MAPMEHSYFVIFKSIWGEKKTGRANDYANLISRVIENSY